MNNKFPGKDISDEDLVSKIPLSASKGKTVPVTVSDVTFGGESVPIVAGPNTVESEEMIVDIALNVKAAGASVLRGGAFKPLTFPYRSSTYRESGKEGLIWLASAKLESQLPVATEVLDIRDLEKVSEVADFLQIGSRNMQNFPLLIEAARTGKAIILKRHYGASLRDWLGAAEYILNEGNSKLILCERGVAVPHTHRSTSRFLLDVQVVPAVHEFSHLPIMLDPSHASFWQPWVSPLACAAVSAGADSIMLEVHPNPREAWVDPLQALNYEQFQKLSAKITKLAELVRKT
jgi:3-deoxy-7-phosphoheptulonate synthase